jgi:hypothetical protein
MQLNNLIHKSPQVTLFSAIVINFPLDIIFFRILK